MELAPASLPGVVKNYSPIEKAGCRVGVRVAGADTGSAAVGGAGCVRGW